MITKDEHSASEATRVDQLRPVVAGQPGANSRPAVTAAATCQTGTSPRENRAPAAAAAAPIAAIASAHPDPAGPGNTGSGANARHHRVNTTRTASTRPANRRNQPRTVPGGRPSSTAIRRCPTPAVFDASAAPITAAVSARRASISTGSSTCVARQPKHRDHRGVSDTAPSGPRTVRARARPHPASTPAHPGHANPPDRRRSSTATVSVSTVSIAPPSATTRPSRSSPAKDTAGGPWPTPTRRSSRWRRRRTRSTRPARQHADLHAQRRQTGPTSSS